MATVGACMSVAALPTSAGMLVCATLAIGAGAGGVVWLWHITAAALVGATLAIGAGAGGVVWLCVGAWGGCSCCIAMEYGKLPSRRWCCRRKEFQRFLIALSVRPGSRFEISTHALPSSRCDCARLHVRLDGAHATLIAEDIWSCVACYWGGWGGWGGRGRTSMMMRSSSSVQPPSRLMEGSS